MVDTPPSKGGDPRVMRVQVPPPAPNRSRTPATSTWNPNFASPLGLTRSERLGRPRIPAPSTRLAFDLPLGPDSPDAGRLTDTPFSAQMESMRYIPRLAEGPLREALDRERSVFLLGPRQTGKTTLVGRLDTDLTVSFLDPAVRLRYERNPSILGAEIEASTQG